MAAWFYRPRVHSYERRACTRLSYRLWFAWSVALWSRREWLVSSLTPLWPDRSYHALRRYADLRPKEYFLWTQVDDICPSSLACAIFRRLLRLHATKVVLQLFSLGYYVALPMHTKSFDLQL